MTTQDLADGHVVAVAVEGGGGVIVTVDDTDLNRLAAPCRGITVVKLASR
jgi:hypothetical protein